MSHSGIPVKCIFTKALVAVPDDEDLALQLGKHLYETLYLLRKIVSHDGLPIKFRPDQFKHAFMGKRNWQRNYGEVKNCVDRHRIERIRWIELLVTAGAPNVKCFDIPQMNGNQMPPDRLYYHGGFSYGVYLFEKQDHLLFSSAYASKSDHWKKRIDSGKQIL